ncbi:MAG: tetratricopeptide repeat protein [Cyclobacteriaceae bacterium]|nr:tetratricopeptide repeat protein [Cyclobacteriaceae bacterium]
MARVQRFNYLLVLLTCWSTQLYSQDQLSRGRLDHLYKKGLELVNHANYGAAREVFTQYLQQSPATDTRRAEAEYYQAYSALNLSHNDAEKLLEEFVGNHPANPRSKTAYLDLANYFYTGRNYTRANTTFTKIDFSALPPDQRIEAYFKWGYSLFNLRKLDDALNKFNQVKERDSQYAPAANYYAGYIAYGNGDYGSAYIDLKRAEANPAYAPIVPQLIANVLYRQKKFDDLIQYEADLQSRAGSVTNYEEISMLVADAYYFKGDYQKAISSYELYLEKNKNKAPAPLLYRAGYAFYAIGNDDRAIEYLKTSAASSDTVGYYASYYLGILYLKQGNKPFASNAFDHSRKYLNDKNLVEESTFHFAKVSYDLGKPDLAITELERFLIGFPSSTYTTEVKEILAQAYVNGNNYNRAIEYIESMPQRSTAVNQAYQKATFLKGTELFNKDDYSGALQYFQKSISYPVSPQYLGLASFWSGEAYSIERQYKEAVPHYQKVIATEGVEPEVTIKTRYGLAYAHFNLQQYEQALFNFKDFTNRSPKSGNMYVDGLVRLADCYYVSKNYQEAVNTYNQARKLNSPDDDYILFQTGVINGILRKYPDARNQFNVLISSYPKSQYRDEAFFQRSQFEIEQGNYEAAATGLTQLINEGSGSRFLPYAYMRRAASYFNLKQYDKTVNDYAAIIQKFPTHPVAHQVLLPLQEALGLANRSDEFDKHLAAFKGANPEDKNLEVVEFEAAKTQYFNQQYVRAINAFKTFIATYPGSARVQEANYYLAESYYRSVDLDNALPVYVQLSTDKDFTFLNRVVARIAEIEFRKGRYEKAIDGYRKMERMATNKKEQFNAWSGMMESFFLSAQYDSVNTYANIIIEKGNINAGAQNKATLYLGKSAMAQGKYDAAKDEFINTLNTAQDEFGAEARYLLGEIFYQTGDHKQCYETLVGMDAKFGAYQEWVGKAFLLLADNFVAMGNSFQAKATLQSLIDNFPLEPIKITAKDKLAKIEATELQQRKQTEADTLGNN